MNGFRPPTSPAREGGRRPTLAAAVGIAAAAAVAVGMVLNNGPHAAAVAAEPGPTRFAVPPAPSSDPSLPVAAEAIKAIVGNPDPDAPTF